MTQLVVVCDTHVFIWLYAARSFTVDAAATYFDWKENDDDEMPALVSFDDEDEEVRVHTVCTLAGRTGVFIPTADEMTDLILLGAAGNMTTVETKLGAFETRTHASICGVRFTAGESLTGILCVSIDCIALLIHCHCKYIVITRSARYVTMAPSSVRLFVYCSRGGTVQIWTVRQVLSTTH